MDSIDTVSLEDDEDDDKVVGAIFVTGVRVWFDAEVASDRGEGSRPALVLRDKVLNHDALRQRIEELAGWLAHEIPTKGARVASWAAKGELTCIMPLAAARAGLVHVPINPLLKRAQAAHILADCGAELLADHLDGVAAAFTGFVMLH